jgi:hypothetical protein
MPCLGRQVFLVNPVLVTNRISAARHHSFGSIRSVNSSTLVRGDLDIHLTKLQTTRMETGCTRPTEVNTFLFPIEHIGPFQASVFIGSHLGQ